MRLGTPTGTKVAGAVGLLVLAALGWVLAVGPQTARLGEVREEITTIQDQNLVLAAQLNALRQQQEELAETRRTARELAAKFPATADQPGLFREVTLAAELAGIGADGVTTLAPTPPQVGTTEEAAAAPQLARQTVTVTVVGTYDETQRLLENLEQMPRAYLVTAVNLAVDSAAGTFTTTVAGDMFVMPPVKDPGKTVNLASTTDPAAASEE
ncbi:type 4a pilus biogenesis protein PilO [Nocardioides pyridinolyticus]